MLTRLVQRLTLAAPLLTITVLSASTGTASADTCHPSGSTLLKSNSQATVYKVHGASKDRYYGCLRSTGRRTHITTLSSAYPPVVLRLRGHFAAVTDGGFVKAVDLSSGNHLKPSAYGQINNLVVSRNGRLAWIFFYHYQQLAWSSFSKPSPHTIDSDACPYSMPHPDPSCIDYKSLRLTGKHHDRQISWLHGSTSKHFVIP